MLLQNVLLKNIQSKIKYSYSEIVLQSIATNAFELFFFLYLCSFLSCTYSSLTLSQVFTLCTNDTTILLRHSNKTIQIFRFECESVLIPFNEENNIFLKYNPA